MQAADLRFIRIPGGSLSDAYDWSRNRSYASAGVLNNWGWSAGMDKFSQLYFYNNQYEGGVCDGHMIVTGAVPDDLRRARNGLPVAAGII